MHKSLVPCSVTFFCIWHLRKLVSYPLIPNLNSTFTVSFSFSLSDFLSKLYLQWCRLVNSERQYVVLLKAVEETYLPLLDSPDTPLSLKGKTDSVFSNWSSLATFHSQILLPAIEGALSQTLQQTDCFSKYVSFVSLFTNTLCFSVLFLLTEQHVIFIMSG